MTDYINGIPFRKNGTGKVKEYGLFIDENTIPTQKDHRLRVVLAQARIYLAYNPHFRILIVGWTEY